MTLALSIVYLVAGIMFAGAAMLAVVRIVRGPSILDRVIASDVLLTTFLLVIGAEMVINQHTRLIPLMVVIAGTAVFGTIAVARYVSKQDHPAHEGSDAREAAEADLGGDDTSIGQGSPAGKDTSTDKATSTDEDTSTNEDRES